MDPHMVRMARGMATLLAVSLGGCTDLSAPTSPPEASRIMATSTALVSDAFERSVSAGWGTADVGGPWRIEDGVLSMFQVNGSQGLIVAPNHRPRNAVATDGYGLDVDGLVSFSIDRMPDNPGRFYTVQVYARRNDLISDGDNYYRYRIRAFGTGKMDVRAEKNVDGARTWLEDGITIPTIWKPNQRYWVRWECIGRSPSTIVRMRVWADGSSEPIAWQFETTVDEPVLDVPGTTGIRVEGPNADQVNFPITFSFDDLRYAAIE